jgi:heptosyltransferase-3
MSGYQPINIQPKRILVITLRYLGDTLLLTPLLASLKQAYPQAEIDVLLPQANLGVLAGNPDISKLIPMTAKGDILSFVKLLCSLFRHYDLAISTQAGDRPDLCAVVAGRVSMGFVDENAGKYSWKRLLLSRILEFSARHGHAVLENLRFCQLLNIAPCYKLTPPQDNSADISAYIPAEKYVVLHPMPQWRYKQWHEAGWVSVASFLQSKGYLVVLSGGTKAEELQVVNRLYGRMPPSTRNLAGKLTLGQLSRLIAGAELFVGPDTGVTHLAAATGVSTLAIYGPTDSQKWSPWPLNYAESNAPFAIDGKHRVGNVYLLQMQMPQACVPCQLEGCEKHRQSHSACLDELSTERVVAVLAELMSKAG